MTDETDLYRFATKAIRFINVIPFSRWNTRGYFCLPGKLLPKPPSIINICARAYYTRMHYARVTIVYVFANRVTNRLYSQHPLDGGLFNALVSVRRYTEIIIIIVFALPVVHGFRIGKYCFIDISSLQNYTYLYEYHTTGSTNIVLF